MTASPIAQERKQATDELAHRQADITDFQSSISLHDASSNPLADLVTIATAWREALARCLLPTRYVSIADLTRVLRDTCEPGFEAAKARVVPSAHGLGVLDHILDSLRNLRDGLEGMERFAKADVLVGAAVQRALGGAVPFLAMRCQVDDALRELKTLEPLFASEPPLQPLSDESRAVWDMLLGRALTSKQIALELGLGAHSDSLVRKRIGTIRKTGRRVPSRKGSGYYRLDAPPK